MESIMAGEKGMIATVARQEGDRVLISFPMVGFGPGFELQPGEKVVIANEEGGPAVRPLTNGFLVDNISEDVAAAALIADERHFTVQPSTIRAQGPITAAAVDESEGPFVVFITDTGESGEPGQVLAVRPEQ